MRRQKVRAVMLVVLTLIASLLVISQKTPARAVTTDWSLDFGDTVQQPNTLMTHFDGSVTAAGGCLAAPPTSTPGYSTVTVNSSGQTTQRLQKFINGSSAIPWVKACEGRGAVGADGTVYATEYQSLPYWPYTLSVGIVAFKNGIKKWGRTAVDICPSGTRNGLPFWVTVGADGDVYAIYAGECKNGNDRLVGISSTTGAIKFSFQLNSNFINSATYTYRLHAYMEGLAVLDGNLLRYFNYQGAEEISRQYSFNLASNESVNLTAIAADGSFYVSVQRASGSTPPDPCGANHNKTKRILSRTAGGTSVTFDLVPYCVAVSTLRSLPNGGIVFRDVQVVGSYEMVTLYSFAADTTLMFRTLVTQRAGFNSFWASWVQVDVTGKMYILVAATETTSDRDRHVWVLEISQTGVSRIVFSTEALQTSGFSETWRFTASENGLSQGAYYLSLCKATTCSSTAPPVLYKIADQSVSIDYPRGTILGQLPSEKKLAVIGDSFISGEGNEPFVAGTAADGVNECHRSTNAYAFKLDYDPQVTANLVAFAACSGATTQNITNAGQWNEAKQIDAIPSDTEAIILSVGGNDIDFAGGAAACAQTNDHTVCESTLSVVKSNAHSAWFAQRVADTYAAILNKSPGADVIVVGYPEFTRKSDGTYCNWLFHSVTALEEQLMHETATKLNQVLADEAALAGFTFVSVASAFDGHAVCDEAPFVNDVDPFNPEYSYHPNAAGVNAIYALLKTALA